MHECINAYMHECRTFGCINVLGYSNSIAVLNCSGSISKYYRLPSGVPYGGVLSKNSFAVHIYECINVYMSENINVWMFCCMLYHCINV